MSNARRMTFILWATAVLVTLIGSTQAVPTISGFIQANGTEFMVDGSPFYFNGFNSYWLMHVAAESSERYKITNVFRDASAAGLTVCRTWAFSDGGYLALQISPGVYSETVFQGLDFVISEAGKYGIRLILSLSNNWQDFGGKQQYVNWARSAGVYISNEDDFYTNDVLKGYYKNHVQKVLTRVNTITGITYKDDPAIMAWELMNEPRCQADYSGNTVNRWVQEMASYLKSIEKKHLLEVGMEGFYGDSVPDRKQYNPGYQVGTDFISNHQIKEIDFATIHAYPDQWVSGGDENARTQFVERWMTSHWNDAKSIIGKPLVFSEFGKSSRTSGYNGSARDSYLNMIYTNIYNLAKQGRTFGGGLVWQLFSEEMENYNDGYEIVLPKNPSTCSVISQQSSKMASLGHTSEERTNRKLLTQM